MLAVPAQEVESASFATHRGEGISFRRLLKGRPGAPDNFELTVAQIDEHYRTPRHFHNFDQLHYVLAGEHEYAPGAVMPTGTVTYFPEGTHYGPQAGRGATLLGLQMGGSSGSGFMSYDQLSAGNKELARHGRFENGIYRRTDETGRTRNQDGYEAIWEHVHGRAVRYPEKRYDRPLTMWPAAFAWIDADEPGVAHKHLATFGERRTTVGFTRIERGATHRVPVRAGQQLHYLVSGRLTCDGTSHAAHTAFQVGADEPVTYRADEDCDLVVIGLPIFPG